MNDELQSGILSELFKTSNIGKGKELNNLPIIESLNLSLVSIISRHERSFNSCLILYPELPPKIYL